MSSIITSLLDTDLYKLTMMQCVLHRFWGTEVAYQFKCRNEADLLPYREEIEDEISKLCDLRFSEDELNYLSSLDFIKPDFVDFLRVFHLNRKFVKIGEKSGKLSIEIEGPWLHTIMFEVPILAIVNEVYFRNRQPNPNYDEGMSRLKSKINFVKSQKNINQFFFSDFGTRRRFSKAWQKTVVAMLKEELPHYLKGTSNVALAKSKGLRPIGTMAHEFLQACQAISPSLVESQKYALETWTKEYRGRLGIALTDVIHLDAFLKDFDLYFGKLFDGLRQDSGDPIRWAERVISHYQSIKIDPKSKTLVFSDALTFEKAIDIYHRFSDQASMAFGIGTNLTNDLGYEPISIVIKMTKANGRPVAKISDSPDKIMCPDDSYVKHLKSVFAEVSV